MLRLVALATLSTVLFASACSEDKPRSCTGTVDTVAAEPVTHYPVGTKIEWSTNPPVTGSHWDNWAKWDRHYSSLARGFYVHNTEHGGVVLLYNCPDGCIDVVASMIEIVRNFPTDPQRPDPPNPYANCVAPVRNRLLVAADPLLPPGVQVAAVAWTTSYTASCFNADEVKSFVNANYEHGTEDVCVDGLLDSVGGDFIVPL